MDLVLAATVGWVGGVIVPALTWNVQVFQGLGGGRPNDEDPNPPKCNACNGFLGALSAVIFVYLANPYYLNAGILAPVTLAFFGGGFASSLVTSVKEKLLPKAAKVSVSKSVPTV